MIGQDRALVRRMARLLERLGREPRAGSPEKAGFMLESVHLKVWNEVQDRITPLLRMDRTPTPAQHHFLVGNAGAGKTVFLGRALKYLGSKRGAFAWLKFDETLESERLARSMADELASRLDAALRRLWPEIRQQTLVRIAGFPAQEDVAAWPSTAKRAAAVRETVHRTESLEGFSKVIHDNNAHEGLAWILGRMRRDCNPESALAGLLALELGQPVRPRSSEKTTGLVGLVEAAYGLGIPVVLGLDELGFLLKTIEKAELVKCISAFVRHVFNARNVLVLWTITQQEYREVFLDLKDRDPQAFARLGAGLKGLPTSELGALSGQEKSDFLLAILRKDGIEEASARAICSELQPRLPNATIPELVIEALSALRSLKGAALFPQLEVLAGSPVWSRTPGKWLAGPHTCLSLKDPDPVEIHRGDDWYLCDPEVQMHEFPLRLKVKDLDEVLDIERSTPQTEINGPDGRPIVPGQTLAVEPIEIKATCEYMELEPAIADLKLDGRPVPSDGSSTHLLPVNPGRHEVLASAVDRLGNRSEPRSVHFTAALRPEVQLLIDGVKAGPEAQASSHSVVELVAHPAGTQATIWIETSGNRRPGQLGRQRLEAQREGPRSFTYEWQATQDIVTEKGKFLLEVHPPLQVSPNPHVYPEVPIQKGGPRDARVLSYPPAKLRLDADGPAHEGVELELRLGSGAWLALPAGLREFELMACHLSVSFRARQGGRLGPSVTTELHVEPEYHVLEILQPSARQVAADMEKLRAVLKNPTGLKRAFDRVCKEEAVQISPATQTYRDLAGVLYRLASQFRAVTKASKLGADFSSHLEEASGRAASLAELVLDHTELDRRLHYLWKENPVSGGLRDWLLEGLKRHAEFLGRSALPVLALGVNSAEHGPIVGSQTGRPVAIGWLGSPPPPPDGGHLVLLAPVKRVRVQTASWLRPDIPQTRVPVTWTEILAWMRYGGLRGGPLDEPAARALREMSDETLQTALGLSPVWRTAVQIATGQTG